MINTLTKPFTDHPNEVGETYFQHMGFALWFCGNLAVAAAAALIHALVPALCKKTASTRIKKMHNIMHSR